MSGIETFFRKIFHGALEHLIVIGLIGLGTYLAATMVPEETALQYQVKTFQVAGTSVAHVQISNQTKRALTLEVRPAFKQLVAFATAISNGPSSPRGKQAWTGQLVPQQQLSVLLVAEEDLPEILVPKLITAKFSVIVESTGAVEERLAEVREASALPISRWVRYGLWFMAPLLIAGVIFAGWLFLQSRRKPVGNE